VGNLTLADFDAELVAQGWDRFTQAQRKQYLNWGYRDIANKFEWLWEVTPLTVTVNPGTAYLVLNGATPDVPNWSSLEWVFSVTDPYRGKLRSLSQDRFVRQWLPLDLTASQNHGNTDSYIVFENRLYLLPPPQSTRSFEIHYHRSVTDLSANTDKTIMPAEFDPAILLSGLIWCHRRAKEFDAENEAVGALDRMIGDLLTKDQWQDPHQPERVSPDNTWL
jgi:hypothetical protein